jgi:hypothetical protein
MGMQSMGTAPARNQFRAANAGGGVKPGEISTPQRAGSPSVADSKGASPAAGGGVKAPVGFNGGFLPGKIKV